MTAKQQALRYLDNMAEIVSEERLIKGSYVDQPIFSGLEGTVASCEGRRYCAIGSLWAGADILPRWSYGELVMPGTFEPSRKSFLAPRHGLRTAYNALNQAAEVYTEVHGLEDRLDREYVAAVEALFEGVAEVGRTELLEVIAQAKAIIDPTQVVPPAMLDDREWELV